MSMAKLLIVLFAVILVTNLSIPAYSEHLSPKKQLELRVSPEDIQCKENLVLVIRDNPACVRESTANKKNWSIIATEFEPHDDSTAKSTLLSREELRELTEHNQMQIFGNFITPFDGMKRIPNPGGYWVPIIDKDEFSEKFLNAVDDELIEITEKPVLGKTVYHTTDGFLNISSDSRHLNRFSESVGYLTTDTAYDQQSQIKYVNNFMNKMGFKVNGNDVTLSESFIDGCFKVWSGYSCSKLNEPFLISIDSWDKYSTDYNFKGQHGNVKFVFNNKAYSTFSNYGIEIKFTGWSNYPEMMRESLDDLETNNTIIDSETAKEKALEFANANYAQSCDWHLYEDEKLRWAYIQVVSGVPFYQVQLGRCTLYYDNGEESDVQKPYFMVDAWGGDLIYIQHKRVDG